MHPLFTNIKNQITRIEFRGCQITALSDAFFDLLSPNLESLNLENNDIGRDRTFPGISTFISKFPLLSTLNLNGNKNLSDADIPWDVLPSRIEHFGLEETNITRIPPEIQRQMLLKSFKASSSKLCVS